MTRLRLLNSQLEVVQGIVIESRASDLRHRAMEAQARWFEEPSSLSRKHDFAYLLLDWGKETQNKTAVEHARSLLA